MQDKTDDKNWGCAYRSYQTTLSWFVEQNLCEPGLQVPSITEIQTTLKRIDHAHENLRVGSKTWIGSVEASNLLQDSLDILCKLKYVNPPDDLPSYSAELLEHFRTQGTPVVMGAGDYAYTMVGIVYDPDSGASAYAIVDPHYTGADEWKPILTKEWVGWKTAEFFAKSVPPEGFINLCLPLLPGTPNDRV
jgi:hypothetical protein